MCCSWYAISFILPTWKVANYRTGVSNSIEGWAIVEKMLFHLGRTKKNKVGAFVITFAVEIIMAVNIIQDMLASHRLHWINIYSFNPSFFFYLLLNYKGLHALWNLALIDIDLGIRGKLLLPTLMTSLILGYLLDRSVGVWVYYGSIPNLRDCVNYTE